jgi:ribonuclease J
MPGDDESPLNDALDALADAAEDAIKRLDADAREDDDAVETAVARAVKKASFRIWERRPIVEATVLRV